MTKKPDLHVTPHPDGWQVIREGSSRASSVHDTQSEAQQAAIPTARRDGVEVVTHRPNGQIRDSDSYGRDPFPPRDKKH